MPVIHCRTYIHAPIHICFDLARDVEAHVQSTAGTRERAVGGVTSGLMKKGDTVTWEAVHFGIRQRLTAQITAMNPPYEFTDIMIKGAFHSFTHHHQFLQSGNGTVMEDTFQYKSPLGLLGKMADRLFLERYMRAFIAGRAQELKSMAERKGTG
ncbi:SRPBCC family protein [Domibacillus indicus]|uniref:SRPBCC family protein n=1 Tax=Domibacillus indicus TaxID=1437523 RepID=UPI000617E9C6|nr:SRPBCC family protein [Domibacillus indicus]